MQHDAQTPAPTTTIAASGQLPGSAQLRSSVQHHLNYSLGLNAAGLRPREAFRAVALAVRDLMTERFFASDEAYRASDSKRLYYLSLEFLIGRSLRSNLVNLGLLETCTDVLRELGVDFGDVEEYETDAALGNGGLGRLAACFLDSLATLGLPGFGYGINYEYGLFRQEIRNGSRWNDRTTGEHMTRHGRFSVLRTQYWCLSTDISNMRWTDPDDTTRCGSTGKSSSEYRAICQLWATAERR